MRNIFEGNSQRLLAPHLVCDNQGTVNSVDKLSKFPRVFPNTMMEAKWDVLAQILEAIARLGQSRPDIEIILGHQDRDIPYEQLSLSAQLHCNADAHANAYLLRDNPTLDHKTAHVSRSQSASYKFKKVLRITRHIKY